MRIPIDALSPAALSGLIEEYITRQSTDHAHLGVALEKRVDQVRAALKQGEVWIVFDPETETTTLLHRDQASDLGTKG
jgi:uncharacterized protein YheU (UPF0270 family)